MFASDAFSQLVRPDPIRAFVPRKQCTLCRLGCCPRCGKPQQGLQDQITGQGLVWVNGNDEAPVEFTVSRELTQSAGGLEPFDRGQSKVLTLGDVSGGANQVGHSAHVMKGRKRASWTLWGCQLGLVVA